MIMKITSLITLSLFMVIAACSSQKPSAQVSEELLKLPGVAITAEAGKFLVSLKEQGKLPGYAKDDHGTVNTNFGPDLSDAVSYPVERTFFATKDGENFQYHYTVLKRTKTDQWELRKAWQTDANGKIIKEFPLQ